MNWLITLLIILFSFILIMSFTKKIIEPMSKCEADGKTESKLDSLSKSIDDFKKDITLKLSVLSGNMNGLKKDTNDNYDKTQSNTKRLKKLTKKINQKMKAKQKEMNKTSGSLDKLN